MGKNKKDLLIISLIAVIILMLGFFAYMFLVRPAINGFIINEQNRGIEYGAQQTVITIAQQAATCNPVPLTVGNDTINLIAIECLQQPQE